MAIMPCINESFGDKPFAVDGELADISIALGKLGEKVREAKKDGKICGIGSRTCVCPREIGVFRL